MVGACTPSTQVPVLVSDHVRYLSIGGPAQATIEVKRSRFRCDLERVTDEGSARATVERVRAANRDARHHCTAFILGPEGAIQRSNDDGEPSGTAGAPMLDALRGAGLTDVLAVVTRWFGGVLLGTGGLIRAYGEAVQTAVATAQLVQVELRTELCLEVGPADAARIENALRATGAAVSACWSAQSVDLRLSVAPDAIKGLTATVAALTSGRGQLSVVGQTWVDLPR